jgi:hypothetical protein
VVDVFGLVFIAAFSLVVVWLSLREPDDDRHYP